MTTGERIKKRREELGLTQTELAERLGYKSRAAICAVEKDKEDMTTNRISKYAMALGVSPAYLMGWVGEEEDGYIYAIPAENIEFSKAYKEKEEAKARELYKLYKNASPDVQQAVETILKSAQPKP